MLSFARFTVAFVCALSVASTVAAVAAPSHRLTTAARAPSEHPVLRGAPAPPRRVGGSRPAAPELWNPLKRRRMAMPLLPLPPEGGAGYAF